VCIDNVTKPFGSGTFANVLTSMTYEDRILGVSQNAEVRFTCLWLATGNNLTYVGDMVRRVVPIVIDPRMERPEERIGFKYPKLLEHLRATRPHLVTAALTVMLAYAQAGCPRQTTTTYGSFEPWYERICGALMWLGEPDPCEGRKALQADVEDELLNFRQLVLCWHGCYHATLSTPRTLKQAAFEIASRADPLSPNAWDDLREALGAFDTKYDGKHLDTRPASYVLRKYKGRVVEKKRLIAGQHTKTGVPWHMELV
jgi:putative DNA primase/helicase